MNLSCVDHKHDDHKHLFVVKIPSAFKRTCSQAHVADGQIPISTTLLTLKREKICLFFKWLPWNNYICCKFSITIIMLAYGIKCTCSFNNVLTHLGQNRAYNREKVYSFGETTLQRKMWKAVIYWMLCILVAHSVAYSWQMCLHYLLWYEKFIIPSEEQILFSNLLVFDMLHTQAGDEIAIITTLPTPCYWN